ncbi:lipoyl(octanoyl) transferase LipB [Paenibacillaceae bacterium]|nr:lipoyl(octanoyl) transferase LipB [Paenibacillaceae bacterium]
MTTIPKTLEASFIPMIGYAKAWERQKEIVKAADSGQCGDRLLLLQHSPTYTIGTQRHPEHLLLDAEQLRQRGIELFEIDRGGDITYHGPGQLVGYPLLYLDAEGLDLHRYLRDLEQVIINWLADYGITGSRKPEYTGVWVGELKIAAIGVKFNRCRQRRGFVTSHGFALNLKSGIAADGFDGIIPCGIASHGVTSFADLTGQEIAMEQSAEEILRHFCLQFGYEPVPLHKEPAETSH